MSADDAEKQKDGAPTVWNPQKGLPSPMESFSVLNIKKRGLRNKSGGIAIRLDRTN
jgi:hypothetical protein